MNKETMKIGHEFQKKNEITVFDFQPEKGTFFINLHQSFDDHCVYIAMLEDYWKTQFSGKKVLSDC